MESSRDLIMRSVQDSDFKHVSNFINERVIAYKMQLSLSH
jgi:hypothetical protein